MSGTNKSGIYDDAYLQIHNYLTFETLGYFLLFSGNFRDIIVFESKNNNSFMQVN